MPRKIEKNRGRPSGKRDKPTIFQYNEWTVRQFDALNISLEGLGKVYYYPSLAGALRGLAKQVGHYSPDVRAATDAWDDLSAKITALAL